MNQSRLFLAILRAYHREFPVYRWLNLLRCPMTVIGMLAILLSGFPQATWPVSPASLLLHASAADTALSHVYVSYVPPQRPNGPVVATTPHSQPATHSTRPNATRLATPNAAPSPHPAVPTVTSPPPVATAPPPVGLLWGTIGTNGSDYAALHAAGVRTRVVRLSWRDLEPTEGQFDANLSAWLTGQFASTRQAGLSIILELGYQDTPPWVHTTYPNSRYVNQYGDAYDGGSDRDSGDANFIFNLTLRPVVMRYIDYVFATFGTDFAAVRLGGGRWGELIYPTYQYAGQVNCYWGFDVAAAATNPVPGWRPGQPSPNGEATRFLEWYLNTLVAYQNWQIAVLRQHYTGTLMMLYPSWGVRPGEIAKAEAGNLSGASTWSEQGGDVQRGLDWARQVAAITDAKVVPTVTWLDAQTKWPNPADPQGWTPVQYLSSLAIAHPLHLKVYGENSGQGTKDAATLHYTASQARRYGLIGMAWYNEQELFSGQAATLNDYRQAMSG